MVSRELQQACTVHPKCNGNSIYDIARWWSTIYMLRPLVLLVILGGNWFPLLKPKVSDTVVQIKISSKTLEQIEKKIQKQGNTWTCQVCNYRGPRNHKSDIMTHAEKHIEGLEYSCTMCDKTFVTSVKMKAHYNSTHNVRTARVFETAEATLKVMNINIELKYKQQLEGMLECRDGLWTCVTCEFSSGSQIKKDQKRKVSTLRPS